MPYVRVWIHFVWAVKDRKPLLEREIRTKVFDHIRENAGRKNIHLDTIGGYLEHAHALISLSSDQTIAKTVQLLKGESSYWVNENSLIKPKFGWQDEYFAVSVSESMVEKVREYIRHQEEHHRKKSFTEEYEEFLRGYGFSGEGLKSV